MIYAIAAIDQKRGIANNKGIPWQGKIPADVEFFREKTKGQAVLMGYGVYSELAEALPDRYNYVATSRTAELRPGFRLAEDIDTFVQNFEGNLWLIGGAQLYASTIQFADELYITQLEGEYGCTKFFPEFESDFELDWQSDPQTQNDITFRFQIWKRKN